MNIFSHLAFYVLFISYDGLPEEVARIQGGYDSCLVAAHTVKQYHPRAAVRCLSGIEYDRQGP